MQANRLIIKKPLISEKATDLSAQDKYVFMVHHKANKKQVKEILEDIYKVHITKINMIRNRNKAQSYKKAIITLKAGETIDVIPH